MKLKSDKIYKCITRVTTQICPTLCTTGATQVYVSLSDRLPKSKDEMLDVSGEIEVGMNRLEGQIRYICCVFAEGEEVTECGIVTDTFKMGA